MLNVGKRSVERARTVLDEGVPELVEAVEQGEIAVSKAPEIAALPKPQQVLALKHTGDKVAAFTGVAARTLDRANPRRAGEMLASMEMKAGPSVANPTEGPFALANSFQYWHIQRPVGELAEDRRDAGTAV